MREIRTRLALGEFTRRGLIDLSGAPHTTRRHRLWSDSPLGGR
jgi:hypothetical protein